MAEHANHEAERAVVTVRGIKAIERLVEGLDLEAVRRIAQALEQRGDEDYSWLLSVLESTPALETLSAQDPLGAARVRGASARRELLQTEGGVVSSPQMAERLGVTRQTVDERRKAHRLIAIDRGKHGFGYPVWQVFEGEPLPGLEEVLAQLQAQDAWSKIIFFLTDDPRLDGKRPLDALREKKIAEVLAIARVFGEQGAL